MKLVSKKGKTIINFKAPFWVGLKIAALTIMGWLALVLMGCLLG